jgi:molybdenum cofactor synthesis domain-containing protein
MADSQDRIKTNEGTFHGELNLLEKTELWVDGITLQGVDLQEIATVAADVLGLHPHEVLVVDVRESTITLDILSRTVRMENITGRESEFLHKLANVRGVTLEPEAKVHSQGILGLLALSQEEVAETLERMTEVSRNVENAVRHRVMVFPSGFEVISGLIKDTNSPFICSRLMEAGYSAAIGNVLPDHAGEIAAGILKAVEAGYGLVITTGGVGAEDKDHTVEGILKLDPSAVTPWLVKYQQGTGRHVKEGVRIAVARVGSSTIIALPGPNDEVKIALDVILQEMPVCRDKEALANKIAAALIGVLQKKMGSHKHHCKHSERGNVNER